MIGQKAFNYTEIVESCLCSLVTNASTSSAMSIPKYLWCCHKLWQQEPRTLPLRWLLFARRLATTHDIFFHQGTMLRTFQEETNKTNMITLHSLYIRCKLVASSMASFARSPSRKHSQTKSDMTE